MNAAVSYPNLPRLPQRGAQPRPAGASTTRRGSLSAAPPSTNREAQLTEWQMEVGLHYLSGTTFRTVEEVLGVLTEYLGEFEEASHGTRLYERLWQGISGTQVQMGNRLSKSEDIYVSLPGEACELLGVGRLVEIATLLSLMLTRVDVAIDYAPFTPSHLNEAYKRGLINTRVRRGGKGRRFFESDTGETFYLGSPSSDTMLRCYNERGFTRVEMQLRRKRARRFWEELYKRTLDDLGELALGVVRAHVDFVIPSDTDSNQSRWSLLPFWAAFVNGAKKVRLTVQKADTTLEKMKQHVRRQAAMLCTYVLVEVAQGKDPVRVARELLEHGRKMMKARHRRLVQWANV